MTRRSSLFPATVDPLPVTFLTTLLCTKKSVLHTHFIPTLTFPNHTNVRTPSESSSQIYIPNPVPFYTHSTRRGCSNDHPRFRTIGDNLIPHFSRSEYVEHSRWRDIYTFSVNIIPDADWSGGYSEAVSYAPLPVLTELSTTRNPAPILKPLSLLIPSLPSNGPHRSTKTLPPYTTNGHIFIGEDDYD